MKKAYVAINYLFTVEPNDVGLNNNCSEEELYAAAEEYMENTASGMDFLLGMKHNDLEINVVEPHHIRLEWDGYDDRGWYCSSCDKDFGHNKPNYNFCPYCGAEWE